MFGFQPSTALPIISFVYWFYSSAAFSWRYGLEENSQILASQPHQQLYVHHTCIYFFINTRSSVVIPEWHLYYNMFSKEHNYYYLKFWPIIILVKNDLLPFILAVHFKIYHRLSWATKLVKDQEFRKFATSLITMISWYTCLNNVLHTLHNSTWIPMLSGRLLDLDPGYAVLVHPYHRRSWV